MKINKQQTISSNSYIHSDISRGLYRQENMARKLKNLMNDNATLQKKIQNQEQEIKDQRKIIVYKINQLAKLIGAKIQYFQEKRLTSDMFGTDEASHIILQELIQQYQQIEKQQKMINRTNDNLQKMITAYNNHTNNINNLIEQSIQANNETQKRLYSQIQEKRIQIQEQLELNEEKVRSIGQMREDLARFEEQEPGLLKRERELMEEIVKYEKLVQEKENKCEEMEKWAEIVIDKKKRKELLEILGQKTNQLTNLTHLNQQLMIKLIQQSR